MNEPFHSCAVAPAASAPVSLRRQLSSCIPRHLMVVPLLILLLAPAAGALAGGHRYFLDCSRTVPGDGSLERPWSRLGELSAHLFQPGDVAALRRGTVCQGTVSLQGSGSPAGQIRLTAYGSGPRPKIAAGNKVTEAVLLKNVGYWQVDSLDIAGGNTYGLLVTGDQDKVQSHITLRNLVVHDVQGGELHDKDNGLVVFLRGSKQQRFEHILIENVTAAHTNQWSGIMMGAGSFYSEEAGYNRDVTIRNSIAHDVYGDGIILFRVNQGLIDSSASWLIGQQATQNVGTPNAIWTWSCTDCEVRDNESFLTESPGVDGGAYDIDWATTRNTVENNYAHDTQGYCMAAFGAGYVTHDAVLRGNVCIDNGLSPRMARLQGAIYIHTWNGGRIDGLTIENNLIDWNPPAPSAAIVNDQDTELSGTPLIARHNVLRSTSPELTRSFGQKLVFKDNQYHYCGPGSPQWIWNGQAWHSLPEMQSAGADSGSRFFSGDCRPAPSPSHAAYPADLRTLTGLDGKALSSSAVQYRLVTFFPLDIDEDGLLSSATMSRLSVLRTLAREYNTSQLQILVIVASASWNDALRNALEDLNTPAIRFVRAPGTTRDLPAALVDASNTIVEQWTSTSFNAATVGYGVRRHLGVPVYAQMSTEP